MLQIGLYPSKSRNILKIFLENKNELYISLCQSKAGKKFLTTWIPVRFLKDILEIYKPIIKLKSKIYIHFFFKSYFSLHSFKNLFDELVCLFFTSFCISMKTSSLISQSKSKNEYLWVWVDLIFHKMLLNIFQIIKICTCTPIIYMFNILHKIYKWY